MFVLLDNFCEVYADRSYFFVIFASCLSPNAQQIKYIFPVQRIAGSKGGRVCFYVNIFKPQLSAYKFILTIVLFSGFFFCEVCVFYKSRHVLFQNLVSPRNFLTFEILIYYLCFNAFLPLAHTHSHIYKHIRITEKPWICFLQIFSIILFEFKVQKKKEEKLSILQLR